MLDILVNPEKEQWDKYVTENAAAKYSHFFDWGKSLAATYSMPLFRLAAFDTEMYRISGILSLIFFSPPGGEIRLISLPYTDSAGMLADDWKSFRKLLSSALTLADKLGANHIELRQDGTLNTFFQQHRSEDAWNYTAHNFKTGLVRPLPSSVDMLWSELSAKVRNQIRKARRCECTVKTGSIELLPDFYAVFSENMRDLGSPVHGLELFQYLMACESLQTTIIVIYVHGKPAAVAFILLNDETLYNPWASSLRIYRPSCPNMLLYWSMLAYAVDHQCRWFDFGRSTPNAPTYRFKAQWGAKKDLLSWHVFSRKPYNWSPGNESLEDDSWKEMDLIRSRQDGPAKRRWISL